MVREFDLETFFKRRTQLPLIDVRSPGEFRHGHIPSAISLPVFTDEERAIIGTIYKRKSKAKAMERALEIVKPKEKAILREVADICLKGDNEILVHCWRGGLRSRKFSEFLSENGVKVNLLIGGYKAYRNAIYTTFKQPWKLIVLGGMTGTGKTDILMELKRRGHQTVCLESLANHRGSAFGRLGQESQPTTEQFQNNLWEQWSALDISRPVIVEDESQAIGSVRIPDDLFAAMRTSPVVNLELSREQRAERLVLDYGKFEISALKNSVLSISKRLGHERATRAVQDLEAGNLTDVAISTLQYYDKAYTFGLNKRDKSSVQTIKTNSGDAVVNAEIVEEYLVNLEL